jgi:ATP-binding cassette subfamily F protein uup
MVILSLEAVSKQYTERTLLDQVQFAISAGERIGVVGVNGSGKSTLLRMIAGVEEPDQGRISRARDLRVAYLSQNPPLNPQLTVIEQIFQSDLAVSGSHDQAMRLLREYELVSVALSQDPNNQQLQEQLSALFGQMDSAGAWELEHNVRTVLSRLELSDLTHRKVSELSGGQRKRVAMAAALLSPSDLLILDEPTNHIDVTTVTWLESYLARSSSALVLVTHDRYFLERVVGSIVEVDRGKLYTYPGNYSTFLEQKEARAAQQASDEARRKTILKKELVWLRRGAQARTTKQQARIDRINAMQAQTPEAERPDLQISSISRRLGKRVIEIKDIAKQFPDQPIINKLTLTIEPLDRLGIVGPNGSGKSTLLNMITGRMQPDSGEIVVGETVHIAYYDQESAGLDPNQRVIDYIKEGAERVQTTDGSSITASQMLERFLFEPNMQYSLIGKLSGGERRRLYLLRVLMSAPNVLLLDEPTNDLDIQTLAVLEDYLDDFAGAVITVSHDRYFLDRVADRLIAFEGDGTVIEYPGSYSYYAEQLAQRVVEAPAPQRPQAKAAAPAAPKTRRLSFKEQREYQQLDQKIADLEAKQAKINQQIVDAGSDFQKLTQLTNELEQVSHELETAFERWAELAEIAEG